MEVGTLVLWLRKVEHRVEMMMNQMRCCGGGISMLPFFQLVDTVKCQCKDDMNFIVAQYSFHPNEEQQGKEVSYCSH